MSSEDKIYLDLQISNVNNGSSAPIPLNYNQTRDTPIVDKASDYEMSITIQYNSSDANLTIYSITLSYETYNVQTYITYVPQNLSIGTPSAPIYNSNKLADNSNTYYNIYNYQYWIYLVNNTFTTCYNALQTLVDDAGDIFPVSYPPVMTFDTTTYIAVLNVDKNGFDNTAGNPISIYFNQPMYEIFNSFPVIIQNLGTVTYGKNCLIDTNTFSNNNEIEFPPNDPTYTAIQIYQEYSTVTLWSPITGLVFTSNSLPVVQSGITQPLNYVDGSILLGNSNNNLYSTIITDFISDGNYKPSIVYEPTAEYRWFTLQGNNSITQIQLSVYWRDRLGTLNQFYLSNGGTLTVKFLFQRKNVIKN